MLYNIKTFILNRIISKLNKLQRSVKIFIAILIDALSLMFSIWLSIALFLDNFQIINHNFLLLSIYSLTLALPILYFFGLYRFIFRYVGMDVLYCLLKSIFLYGLIYMFLIFILDNQFLLYKFLLVHSMFFLVIGSLTRISLKYFFIEYSEISNTKNVIIYGAGMAGRQIAAALHLNKNYKVIGFFDDNKLIHKLNISGLKVYNPEQINNIIKVKEVSDIILAIPSLTHTRRYQILKTLDNLNIKVKTLPYISEIVSGKVKVTDIIELNIVDLLTREVIEPIPELLNKAVNNKTIIITGAGGSIGSEICKQLLMLRPKKLILIDFSESSLYYIDNIMNGLNSNFKKNNKVEIISIIASVCNYNRINEIIKAYKPDTIYHSAAYKHVPLVESNLSEGIVNNIFGTINIANIALQNNISNFVLISTDKAVRPTNVMGATKRVSELYLQAFDKKIKKENKYKTKFSIVRFGNVLDSSGSVVPLFKRQIKNGGPITLTHKNVERYFMTIPEAAQLVIQTTSMARGGEVFVLGMGERVKIYILALKMIKLSGLTLKDSKNPNGDIAIKYIGLRPGEKMYEELLINNKSEPTLHPRIIKGKESFYSWKKLNTEISILDKHIKNNDILMLRKQLGNIVKEYNINSEIVDLIFKEKITY